MDYNEHEEDKVENDQDAEISKPLDDIMLKQIKTTRSSLLLQFEEHNIRKAFRAIQKCET